MLVNIFQHLGSHLRISSTINYELVYRFITPNIYHPAPWFASGIGKQKSSETKILGLLESLEIGEGTVHHSPTWIPNGRPEIRHFFFHRAKVAVDLDHQKTASRYPLVMSKLLLKMAIEIVSFPMKNGDFP
jgi:hypothetical protein